jgi:hypothetical protein
MMMMIKIPEKIPKKKAKNKIRKYNETQKIEE